MKTIELSIYGYDVNVIIKEMVLINNVPNQHYTLITSNGEFELNCRILENKIQYDEETKIILETDIDTFTSDWDYEEMFYDMVMGYWGEEYIGFSFPSNIHSLEEHYCRRCIEEISRAVEDYLYEDEPRLEYERITGKKIGLFG